MQVGVDDFRRTTRYNSKNVDRRKRCYLSSVASLRSHCASTFVCSTFALMQHVARVRKRQLILVLVKLGGGGDERNLETMYRHMYRVGHRGRTWRKTVRR